MRVRARPTLVGPAPGTLSLALRRKMLWVASMRHKIMAVAARGQLATLGTRRLLLLSRRPRCPARAPTTAKPMEVGVAPRAVLMESPEVLVELFGALGMLVLPTMVQPAALRVTQPGAGSEDTTMDMVARVLVVVPVESLVLAPRQTTPPAWHATETMAWMAAPMRRAAGTTPWRP